MPQKNKTYLKKEMKYSVPINILLGLLFAVILFHISVIAKAIPYDIAWGGRLRNDSEMYLFETISIFINLFLGLVLAIKGGYIKFRFNKKRPRRRQIKSSASI